MSGAWAPGPSWSQPPAPSLLLLLWCLHQSKRGVTGCGPVFKPRTSCASPAMKVGAVCFPECSLWARFWRFLAVPVELLPPP